MSEALIDPNKGGHRTIKRLLKKKKSLKADIAGLEDRIGKLADCLAWYACDCPEYKAVNCRKEACGKHAAEVLFEEELAAKDRERRLAEERS